MKIKDDSVACYQNNPDGSMYLTTYNEDRPQNKLPFPKLMTDKDRFEDLFGTEGKRSFKEINSEAEFTQLFYSCISVLTSTLKEFLTRGNTSFLYEFDDPTPLSILEEPFFTIPSSNCQLSELVY